jgi:hypothetical protein
MYKGAATLLRQLESYLFTMAKNMQQAQSGPFEAVSDGISKLKAVFFSCGFVIGEITLL